MIPKHLPVDETFVPTEAMLARCRRFMGWHRYPRMFGRLRVQFRLTDPQTRKVIRTTWERMVKENEERDREREV